MSSLPPKSATKAKADPSGDIPMGPQSTNFERDSIGIRSSMITLTEHFENYFPTRQGTMKKLWPYQGPNRAPYLSPIDGLRYHELGSTEQKDY